MKNTLRRFLLSSATTVAITGLSASAWADDYGLIILDQTGSMDYPYDDSDTTNWQNAITMAQSYFAADGQYYQEPSPRKWAIFTFTTENSETGGLHRVFPVDEVDCSSVSGSASNYDDEGWCSIFPTTVSLLSSRLEAMRSDTPSGNTPLASALCEALDLGLQGTNDTKHFILQSDGDENWSEYCAGIGESDSGYTEWETSEYDWGMTLSGHPYGDPVTTTDATWEATVVRKLMRQNAPSWDAGMLGTGPNDDVIPPIGVVWHVDYHYEYCQYDATEPCNADSGTSAALVAPFPMAAPLEARLPEPDTLGFTAPDSSGYISQEAHDFSFFKSLGSSTPGSTFRGIVRFDQTQYGVDHVLPGDVDDSGCVDQADLSIIMQSDVWLHVASDPLQIAVRADLTRDGWINEEDRDYMLQFWGLGCINPLGPAPTFPDTAPTPPPSTPDPGPSPLPSSCTLYSALDLGGTGTATIVSSDACVKIDAGRPSWWGTSRNVLLQTGSTGTYPVPFTWTSTCTSSSGGGYFDGAWQSQVFGSTSNQCPTLIQLEGDGSDVSLIYYGQ